MTEIAKEIISVAIEDELKESYLDYAMSVIVSRALPDVRDGLKPVHRRILYAMHELGNDWNKPYKKSARIVGDVIGKYHPHGDAAVYETIVRMAQPFSMRAVLIDGQGNFGSVDGDAPAAMRYTEIRMTKLAHALLADLDKNTVDFVPNYDETELAPAIMPAKIPHLLINGSSGIAVGMATNIPPHNLNEIIDACIALIDHPEYTVDNLLKFVPGPDFPTAAIINGRAGIVDAYRTGRGKIHVRARTHTEETETKTAIIVTELPYQVNKARLIEKIAELAREKKIEGISGLRDESDKDGMRIVIELKRGELPEVVLNNLYAHTAMETMFGVNMVALDESQPRTLNLKQMLEAFLRHRREVVTRRTLFELNKAKARAHILEGLSVALINIDALIQLIKTSKDPATAKERLLQEPWLPGNVGNSATNVNLRAGRYFLTSEQAQAILDLKLHRLTGLEQNKIAEEYEQLLKDIAALNLILGNESELLAVIKQELIEIKKEFGDKRRTEIIESKQDLTIEDLIVEEDLVVTLSHDGYVKSQPISDYRAQHRGGRGKVATRVKEEDYIERIVIAHSHATILCFSNVGKVYWLKVYQFPIAERNAKGRPIINLLPLEEHEHIQAFLPIKEFRNDRYIFMATAKGIVKKVILEAFSKPRGNGIIALNLEPNDQLIGVALTDGLRDIMLFSDAGKAIRFPEKAVRPMGRTAHGVRGMKIPKEASVIALVVAEENSTILTVTENGYGKRSELTEYRITGRGVQGVISIQANVRNGKVIGALTVQLSDQIILITDQGVLIRTRIEEISVVGRNTQGVRLIQLSESEKLCAIARVEEIDNDNEETSSQ